MGEKDVAYADNGVLLSHKSEILSFETTWVGLEGIMLSEISQRHILLSIFLHLQIAGAFCY